jgi:hypothetical protein
MVSALARGWKLLVLGGIAFLALAAGGIVLIPLTYESRATLLLISSKESAGGTLSLLKEAAGLGNLLGQDGADFDQANTLLESDKLAFWAIEKYHLDTMWQPKDAKKPMQPEMLAKMWGTSFHFHMTDYSGYQIYFKASSAPLTRMVVEGVCQWLDSVTLEIGKDKTRRNLKFIEEQLAFQTAAFDTAQSRLIAFQKKNRILALPEQVQASVEGSAKLESEALMAEIQAKSAAAASGSESSEARRWNDYRDLLRGEARRVLSNPGSAGSFQGFDKGFEKLSEIQRLQREVLARKAIYTYLAQQREQLFLESQKSLPTLFVVDHPFVPQKAKSPPRRALFMLAAIFWAIGCSTWLVGKDFLRRRSWSSEEKDLLKSIQDAIPFGRLLGRLF